MDSNGLDPALCGDPAFVSRKKIQRRVFAGLGSAAIIPVLAILYLLMALPGFQQSTRVANVPHTYSSLRQIGKLQSAIRTNDLDGNGVSDYWIDDVAFLHYGIPSRRLDRSVAEADARPATRYRPGGTRAPHTSAPSRGYWFCVLKDFDNGTGTTDYSKARTTHFAVGAFPDRYGTDGKLILFLDQNGRLGRRDPGTGAYWNVPPNSGVRAAGGILSDAYDTCPLDRNARSGNGNTTGPWSTCWE